MTAEVAALSPLVTKYEARCDVCALLGWWRSTIRSSPGGTTVCVAECLCECVPVLSHDTARMSP